MPAAGLPVASITTSIPSAAIIASASSVTKVVPCALASAKDFACEASGAQPTRRSASCARAGARSAIAMTWSPVVRGACARNIEPNLPAPMRPTRTGLPASARALSFAWRFMRYSAAVRCAPLSRQSSGRMSIGVKSRLAIQLGRLKRRIALSQRLSER